MFNSKARFTQKLLSGVDKTVTLRFPTDAELMSRSRRLVTVTRGNGTQDLKDLGGVEQAFVAQLLEGDNPELSEGEAIYVSDRLLRAKIVEANREGNRFTISLRVPGGEVNHSLDIPTLDAARKYAKTSFKTEPKRNKVESHQVLDGVAPFWASMNGAATGYAEGSEIPLNHKEAAIEEIIGQLHAAMEDTDPED
jgi:hypothetical protein